MTVAVVTDSTASLPPELAAGLEVVPLHLALGDVHGLEGHDLSPADVAAALGRRVRVATSRPSPEALAAAYARAAAQGAEGVVSVHIAARLSGTVESARVAAATSAVPVEVVDSASVGMGLGFAALAGVAAAGSGAALPAVVDAVRGSLLGTTTLFAVDTLEHLRRGGRIGAAQALLGSALAVKPLLEVRDGAVAVVEKVRTSTRAVGRLVERAIAATAAAAGPVQLAVHHLQQPQRAADLAATLRARLPEGTPVRVSELSAAVAAHTGPEVVGVVVAPRG